MSTESWTEYGWRDPDGETRSEEVVLVAAVRAAGWTRMGRTVTASAWLPVP